MKNKVPIIHSQLAVSSKASCFDQHLARSGDNGQKENKNGIPHYSVAYDIFAWVTYPFWPNCLQVNLGK